MRVLAIDTSTPICALAVLDGARVLAEDQRPSDARHGEVLLPRVRVLLAEAGLTLEALELIAVGVGPGSFTGLRIGLATAKGLALATSLPLRGVCSLRALGAGLSGRAELALCALDAGKGELFVAAYGGNGCLLQTRLAPLRATPEAAVAQLLPLCARASSIMLAGTGARRHPELAAGLGAHVQLAEPETDAPRGRYIAEQALCLLREQGPSDLAALEPNYLRGPL